MNKISRILLVAVIISCLFAGVAAASGSHTHTVYEENHEHVEKGKTITFHHDSHDHKCKVGDNGDCEEEDDSSGHSWDVEEGQRGETDDEKSCEAVDSSISLKKSSLGYDAITNNITYKYVINNTGNVTLRSPFNITDDKIGTFTCLETNLNPGQNGSCTREYHVPDAACSITNTANATVMYSSNQVNKLVTSNDDTVTVPVSSQNCTGIPEFPTVALPIAAVIGMVFLFQRRKNKE